jgi:ubiquinone/menaquinone biosynthesis C-methylase UbiE
MQEDVDPVISEYAQAAAVTLSGLDPVPEMLAVARTKLSKKVDLREGWAEALPWPNNTFDLIVSCNMFHYIIQPVAAVREMERVVRPDGKVVITD